MSPAARTARFRFGQYEFEAASGELKKSGIPIRLPGQPAQVLHMLLERSGQVVTRQELRERLWPPDTYVEFDSSLNTAVKRIRQALLDDPEQPRFVETI